MMIKVLFFLWKYKILKDVVNLSYQTRRFFQLSDREQKIILDKYFEKFGDKKGLETYFDSKESRYYDNSFEVTFFHCYYFDKKLIEYDIRCIGLIDKFKIDDKLKESLIDYSLSRIRDEGLVLKSNDLINYPDDLPLGLSSNLKFMRYLVSLDEANIKYITYNENCISSQRELIKEGIESAKEKNYSLRKFLKNDGNLPKILERNFDFLIYLLENDIENVNYLDEKVFDHLTISNRRIFIDTVISSLKKNPDYFHQIEKNLVLSSLLNQDEIFIQYMLTLDVDYVRYVDWHNIHDGKREMIINYITDILRKDKISFHVMKYPFRELFFENYQFMDYLIRKDFRWISVIRINDIDCINRLVDTFFEIVRGKKYHFCLDDFLEDGKYLNHRLVENTKLLHYFIVHRVAICHYVDFFHLESPSIFVDHLLKEMERKDFEFSNDDFLVDGKYPIPLSNSYRFMRFVIDRNFNHLAYIDVSMIDRRELKRIINYAFRIAYYIRGDNKKLNFDIDGYFKGMPILEDEYFQECLNSF